jgi:hypothetical protein
MNTITIQRECSFINYVMLLNTILINYNNNEFYKIETNSKLYCQKNIILEKLKENTKIVYECNITDI